MRWVLMALMCLSCGDERPNTPAGSYRLAGWFYANALVTDTDPGQEPVPAYDGPISFSVYHGPTGEHSFLGAVCGPRDGYLECSWTRVEVQFGNPVVTRLEGVADETAATFHVEQDIAGQTYLRDWVITEMSRTPPGQAINTAPPPLRRRWDEFVQ